MVIKFFSS